MADSKVLTVLAGSRPTVAGQSMSVTIALQAVGEIPEAGGTLVASPAVGVGNAGTLAIEGVTEVIQRASLITRTGCETGREWKTLFNSNPQP